MFLPWNLPVTWCGNGCGIEVFLGETTGIKLFPWGRQVECVCSNKENQLIFQTIIVKKKTIIKNINKN